MILRVAVALIYLFLLAPVLIVCVVAVNPTASFAFPPDGWSLRWFQAFFESREFVASLLVSLKLAVAASVVSLVLGVAAAIGLEEVRGRGIRAVEVFFMSPLFIPRILVGVLIFLLLMLSGLRGSFLGLLFAHVLVTAPYVVRTVLASLHGLDPSLVEAARTMGATRARTFRAVTLPLIKTGMVAGFLFAFSVSFTDFYLALFLSGPETMTLPVQIFHYLEWEQDPVVAAAGTVQIVIIMILSLAIDRFAGLGRVVGSRA